MTDRADGHRRDIHSTRHDEEVAPGDEQLVTALRQLHRVAPPHAVKARYLAAMEEGRGRAALVAPDHASRIALVAGLLLLTGLTVAWALSGAGRGSVATASPAGPIIADRSASTETTGAAGSDLSAADNVDGTVTTGRRPLPDGGSQQQHAPPDRSTPSTPSNGAATTSGSGPEIITTPGASTTSSAVTRSTESRSTQSRSTAAPPPGPATTGGRSPGAPSTAGPPAIPSSTTGPSTTTPATTGPATGGPATGGRPSSSVAGGDPIRCGGLLATIVGTNGPDTLIGTPGPDVIFGGNGSDVIVGLGGDDVICGGNGGDRLDGGAGNDRLIGGHGKDHLIGGPGDDEFEADDGLETIES